MIYKGIKSRFRYLFYLFSVLLVSACVYACVCVCVCVCVDLSSKQIFLARIYTLNIFFLHSFHFLLLLLVVFLLSSLCIVYEGWKDVDMNHYFTLRVMLIPKFFQYLQTRYNWFCGNINEAIVAGDWCMSCKDYLLLKTDNIFCSQELFINIYL